MWLESHQALLTHRKTMRATALAEISTPQLIGHLHMLWWWGLDNADADGSLGDTFASEIEMVAGWAGPPGKLVDALLGAGGNGHAGFLDQKGYGFKLHDWGDYGGKLKLARAKNAARTAKWRGKRLEEDLLSSRTDASEAPIMRMLRSSSSAEEESPESLPAQPASVAKFDAILRDWPHYTSSDAFLHKVAAYAPRLDLESEAIKALDWLQNQANRKGATKGTRRFFLAWLERSAAQPGAAKDTAPAYLAPAVTIAAPSPDELARGAKLGRQISESLKSP